MSLRERKKQQARQDILTSARELIDQHGYEHAKMRDIAEAANLSYQTLYNYFPAKALILQALLLEDVAETTARVDALSQSYQSGTEDLLTTLHAIHRARMDSVSPRDRALWRVAATDLSHQPGRATTIYQLIDAGAHQKLEVLLAAARGKADLNPHVDCALLAETLIAIGDHTLSRYIMEASTPRASLLQTLEAQTDLLMKPYLQQELHQANLQKAILPG